MLSSRDKGYESTPTFRQFCKAQGKLPKPLIKLVTKIWLPNQYPSVSLHTECFRLRIHENSDIYEALIEKLGEWEDAEACIAIRVSDTETLEFEIIELEQEGCTWNDLGDYGKELKIKERKPVKGKRAAKT